MASVTSKHRLRLIELTAHIVAILSAGHQGVSGVLEAEGRRSDLKVCELSFRVVLDIVVRQTVRHRKRRKHSGRLVVGLSRALICT